MPQSVPSQSAVQATFAATLFDELIALGLVDVVVCPGSRSTPLALACAERAELNVHVRIDERSAGFFAIGRALATHRPVAIVVTSGTAAAELHACVAEADQAFVPLLVITADRPPELHGVGAPQTIDQHELFGAMVRRFEEPGVASLDGVNQWRQIARRLWRSADGVGAPRGPAHLNAAFVEPLVAQPLDLPVALADMELATTTDEVELEIGGQRVLCVVGRGVDPELIARFTEMNWVVLGDATTRGSLAYFDPIVRCESFIERARPDVVVRLGGLCASKVLQERLREWRVRTIAFDGAGFVSDPDRLVTESVCGVPAKGAPGDAEYFAMWHDASRHVGDWLGSLDDDDAVLGESMVARITVAESTSHDVALVVGSSMAVREVEWWSPPRRSATYSNRGVNGIDGVVSTVLGVACDSRALGLIGDLTMLHDVSGLVDGLGIAGGSCVLVVLDNRGGGIFSFLSQATLLDHDRFEMLFATPRPHDLALVARSFGHRSETVRTQGELRDAIRRGLATTGLSVVVATVSHRTENVRVHEQWNQKVDQLVGGHS